jgi:hypothetical protein
MRRLVSRLVVALLCFGAGWLVAETPWTALQPQRVFRLSFDTPTGETRVKCDGCQFLTWIDGRAGTPEPTLTVTCGKGPCWTVVGAVAVTPEPQQIAQAEPVRD